MEQNKIDKDQIIKELLKNFDMLNSYFGKEKIKRVLIFETIKQLLKDTQKK